MTADAPRSLRLRRQSRLLEVVFPDGAGYAFTFEFLRVMSPSAEVRGHGPGQEVLQVRKEHVGITRLEPTGHYAVRLVFDDGHDSGLYSWPFLRELGEQMAHHWQAYVGRLERFGVERLPDAPHAGPGHRLPPA